MSELKKFLNLSRDELKKANFGKSLEKERVNKELTKADLARAIKVTPVMVSRYEKSLIVPSIETLEKLVNFFEENKQNDDLTSILEKKLSILEEKLNVLNELEKVLKKK